MENKSKTSENPEKYPSGLPANLKGLSPAQVKTNQLQATKAEREAISAESHASMAKARAGKVKVGIGACIHKLTVTNEIIQTLSKKAEAEARRVEA